MGSSVDSFHSHPDKLLETHINGVLQKALKSTQLKIAELAIIFHDLGKMNPNFQEKLKPGNRNKYLGYTAHSYLSAFAFLCFLANNQQLLKEILQAADTTALKLEVQRIIALIAHHHGNLPDLKHNLKEDPKKEVLKFLDEHPILPISHFLELKLKQKHEPFNLDLSEDAKKQYFFRLVNFSADKEVRLWRQKALEYFLDTQFAFAALIEADKRDAGNNENYFFEEGIQNSVTELHHSLKSIFSALAPATALNRLRTQIREEAVANLKEGLNKGKRVFTLAAPTGAGKTFTLLALASEIQSHHPDVGILYALPFLSITEQVESICRKSICEGKERGLLTEVLSVNSKAVNERIQRIQIDLETDQNDDHLKRLIEEDFIGQTFDHPFIITTFVQFFETLLSNKNSTLLKLPNFRKRVFLIDEIQALPPRLYIFFAAWLDAFCYKYDAYAVLSTATMPHFAITDKSYLDEVKQAGLLFKNFQEPYPVLAAKKFFVEDVFNRYRINLIDELNFSIELLANHVSSQSKPSLVILNTIKDTKQLYTILNDQSNVYLLNTHFTPEDRREKIEIIKKHLERNEHVILISTQLIEAGVDIDFPIVYRDLCPLPSLIQSAGRCNRNNTLPELGQIYFFNLTNDKGKSSAELVYRNEAKRFLEFCRTKIINGLEEKYLYDVQHSFFNSIASDLSIGEVKEDFNLIECVNNAQFEKLGKFKLIEEREFGYEYQYYIPKSTDDHEYERAVELMKSAMAEKEKGFKYSKRYAIGLKQQLKKLADRTITIRTFSNRDILPLPSNSPEYFQIKVLADLSLYSFEEGFNHTSVENAFL